MKNVEGNLSYKVEHESFVSGHSGSDVLDIAILVSSAPVGVLFRNILIEYCCLCWNVKCAFLVDFSILILLSSVLCFTMFADCAFLVITVLITASISLLTISKSFSKHRSNSYSKSNSDSPTDSHSYKHTDLQSESLLKTKFTNRPHFITDFRAYVSIATAACILAVDFSIFPRRFCKAETYGTGLMDVGVGAFVISNAIVSKEARRTVEMPSNFSEILSRILKSFTSTAPLWILGFCRLAAVKGTNYHEHVSEYGVHWNFFFTLAVVRVLSSIILLFVNPKRSWLVSLSLALLYEYALISLHLDEYLLNDNASGRIGLLDANREGIFSCLGYLAIYFAGVQLGDYLFRFRSLVVDWLRALITLVVLDITLWVMLAGCQEMIAPVSRRMANLSYSIWMVAHNVQLLASFLFVDLLQVAFHHFRLLPGNEDTTTAPQTVNLLEAVNRNGLLYFLLANLLTGFVNMSMATIYASKLVAVLTISAYMFILSVITALLHHKNVTVKCW